MTSSPSVAWSRPALLVLALSSLPLASLLLIPALDRALRPAQTPTASPEAAPGAQAAHRATSPGAGTAAWATAATEAKALSATAGATAAGATTAGATAAGATTAEAASAAVESAAAAPRADGAAREVAAPDRKALQEAYRLAVPRVSLPLAGLNPGVAERAEQASRSTAARSLRDTGLR